MGRDLRPGGDCYSHPAAGSDLDPDPGPAHRHRDADLARHLQPEPLIESDAEPIRAEAEGAMATAAASPNKIEWLRFEAGSPMPDMLKTIPHIAYEVDDLDAEMSGAEVLLDGVRAADIDDEARSAIAPALAWTVTVERRRPRSRPALMKHECFSTGRLV